MNHTAITALRKDAYALLGRIPDDKLVYVVEILKGIDGLASPKRTSENSPAFRRLMELRRPIPDLNEEKELAFWRERKYGYEDTD